MGNCFSCNKEIGEDAFCSYCGERQACGECGVSFTKLSSFCSNCGAKRAESSAVQNSAQQAQQIETSGQQQTERMLQTAETPQAGASGHQPGQKTPFMESIKQTFHRIGKRNLSIIGGVLVVLIAFFIYQGSSEGPEEVVEKYFAAMSSGDISKLEQTIDPRIWQEWQDDASMLEGFEEMHMLGELMPTFEVLALIPEDAGENYVEFEATVKMSEGAVEETETATIEVIQYDNKWFISDMY